MSTQIKDKDFDLQLFANAGDGEGKEEKVEENVKIKVKDKEYTEEEISEALAALTNKKEWQKENTRKSEEIAQQRREIEETKKVLQAWEGIDILYRENEQFRNELDDLVKRVNDSGVENVDDLEALVGQDPKYEAIVNEVKAIKEELKIQRKIQEEEKKQQIAETIQSHILQVEESIKTNQDDFTIEDVTQYAEENKVLLPMAYKLMRGDRVSDYVKRGIDKEVSKKIEEYEKKRPPITPPPGGGGITTIQTPFKGYEIAAKEAAQEFKIFE